MTTSDESPVRVIETPTLAIGTRVEGPESGWPVVLLHGFPYDVHSYDAVTALLLRQGARVITPYLRGFGPTRFRDPHALRSGQQAAIGTDVAELIRESGLDAPVLAGFDWGGRAACVAAALWPELVGGLVAIGGNEIQDIAGSTEPTQPLAESRHWYQYYFHSERGRAGLTRYRREIARQLWEEWEPGREIDTEAFARTAAAFDNPDFVDVAVHSYRHRYGLVPGDARYDEAERLLADRPVIEVPTIVLDPTEDPVTEPRGTEEHRTSFSDLVGHIRVSAGHDTPRDAPEAVAAAVVDLHARIRRTP
ncbi:alpha/beta hydrolase [Streptomyces asoensis]|uniref:alpha/beta fold hydrolase n=1 Tax=Streptomyces asoensis TaxID=249586 RepID=UPI00340FAD49